MTALVPGGPARQGLAPPKRSPSRVTATTPGSAERDVERSCPPAVDEHVRREEAGEHAVEARPGSADARAERTRPRRREHALRAGAVRADDEEQRVAVARLQLLDRGAGPTIAFDDDRVQRLAERGGDRDFGAGFDVDVVDQWTDDTVVPGDCFATGRRVLGVERERQRFGAGAPARCFCIGVAPPLLGRVQRFLGGLPGACLRVHVGGDLRVGLDFDPQPLGRFLRTLRGVHLR